MTLNRWLNLSKKLRDCGFKRGIDIEALLMLFDAHCIQDIELNVEAMWSSIQKI